MKVIELIDELQKCNPDSRVVLPIETAGLTIGGQPFANTGRVYEGFDWDHGKVFIEADGGKKLTLMETSEWKQLIEYKQLIYSLRGRKENSELSKKYITKEKVNGIISLVYSTTDMEESDKWALLDLIDAAVLGEE